MNSLCWPTEEEAWWLWRGLPLGGALKLCGKEGEGYGGWKDQDQLRSGMVVGRGGWGDSVEPGQVLALPGKGGEAWGDFTGGGREGGTRLGRGTFSAHLPRASLWQVQTSPSPGTAGPLTAPRRSENRKWPKVTQLVSGSDKI